MDSTRPSAHASSLSASASTERDRDNDAHRSSSSDGEFSEIPFDDDGASLRPARALQPTIVQLPKTTRQHLPPPAPPSTSTSASLMPLDAIDPDFLNELPPEIQQEILLEHAASQKRATDAAIQEALHGGSLSMDPFYEGDGLRLVDDGSDDDDGSFPLNRGNAAAAVSENPWVCTVCTFANHPQLAGCEMCDTARPDAGGDLYWEDDDGDDGGNDWTNRRPSKTGGTENAAYSKITQRIQSSAMANQLKKIRVPATPATTSLTQKDEPTAEDLLIAATVKIQQFQSSASQSIQQATQSFLAKANSARRPSLLSSGKQQHQQLLPSPQATVLLTTLQKDLSTKCEPGDELYESLLLRLWTAIYVDAPSSPRTKSGLAAFAQLLPRRPFGRVSSGWVDMGFQGPNPDTDFRGGGLLALKCLVYVFEAYPHKMLEIVASQKPTDDKGKTKWYPVCVAGINLTCMIAGLLKLGNGHFARHQEPFWTLFEEPSAFYQLFFHAFVKMHAVWHRMNATFMEFGVVLKATRRMVVHMLEQAPQTLAELNLAAEKTFIDRFVVSVATTFLAETENGECPDPFNLLEDESEVLVASPRSALSAMASKLTSTSAAEATQASS